jgi:hypothetical protein
MPVHRRDKSDSNRLPDPELNPLVNPLLAAHMGRWAEVYFTNPPEKRDQAVSELLRELENVVPPQPALVQGLADSSRERKMGIADSPNESSSLLEPGSTSGPARTCTQCAYNNPGERSFCGMCGALLPVSPEIRVPQGAGGSPIAADSWHERSLRGGSFEDAIEPAVRSAARPERSDALGLSSLLPEKRIPQKSIPHISVEPQFLSYRYQVYRYRFYIGAVLAILLSVVGYMAGRRPRASLDTAGAPSAPTISQGQPASANSAQTPGVTGSASPTAAPLPLRVQNKSQADANSPNDQVAGSRFPSPTLPAAAGSSTVAQSGAAELATAETYLNGAPGVTRDSAEAAQWLWKAVGKQNLEATLALSDLYLRGDGVSKSCDQARLLLDAAARKGAKAAAERLRRLQASGCD